MVNAMHEMDTMRLLQLSRQGFHCAQILLLFALESEDKENPDLIRAAGGLNIGLSDMKGPCGALTGGCCFISYFSGKGEEDELEDPAYREMLGEFTAWFRDTYGHLYGGFICEEILDGNTQNMRSRCPGIVQESYAKALEILQGYGVL